MRAALMLAGILLLGAETAGAQGLALDEVIVMACRGIEEKVKGGSNLAVLNFTSGSDMFSDYVIEELTGLLVMSGKVSVIERRSLDLLREELHFQLSGDVSDDLAMSIGRQVGAQSIVTGSLQDMGTSFRFRIKAVNVESARIEAQYSYNLKKDERTAFLLGGQGGHQSSGAQQTRTQAAASGAAGSSTGARAGGAAASGTGAMTQAGLYSGAAFQGAMDLYGAIDWLAVNAQTGGNYTIVLDKDQAVIPTELSYPNKTVSITLKCAGEKRKVTFEGKSPSYSLFTVRDGVTFTLEEGITLEGAQNDTNKSLVHVAGGTFVMNGATLTGNKTTGRGGGVYVAVGKFSMNNSTISKNTAAGGYGGGVYVASGGFTMENSVINGNTASGNGNIGGGGVYIASGMFTLNNSTISGNTCIRNGNVWTKGCGGGIYVKGTFTMNSGTISGNTSVNGEYSQGYGGGVYVEGTFTMHNGTISSNTSNSNNNNYQDIGGGGVWVKGTFTMAGGTISGNTANGQCSSGGGVYVTGPFTMTGGTISGNTAKGSNGNSYGGGGVYVTGAFIKSGGVIHGSNAQEAGQPNIANDDSRGHAVAFGNDRGEISKKRNITARETTVMDSEKNGPSGGWE
jgi:hypothetical protein